VLVVCKRWFRIALPLLYTCLFLSKPKHMKTVARAVQSDPQLGRAICHLWLEGGFGKELYSFMKLAPNVETLYLILQATSNDLIAGL
ncbi:uncharacterized protein PHACADRAFT_106800, partial [Phanerochaete carnosa HHB-10118-sp]